MQFFKRAVISVMRNPVKSGILFFLVLILSLLTSGAISVRQAIHNTDQNLRRQMPSIVTITYDLNSELAAEIYAQTGEWPKMESLTPDIVREIGQLPQVYTFDYAVDMTWGVTGQGLRPWEDPEFPAFISDYDEDLGVNFHVRGVSSPDFLELLDSFAELIAGRNFYENEITLVNSVSPTIISSGFAVANGLEVGSIFETQVVVYELEVGESGEYMTRHDLPPITEETFQLEVVGIVQPILPELVEDAGQDEFFQRNRREASLQHRLFIPNAVAENMFNVRSNSEIEPSEMAIHNFFMLNDPMDFNDFTLEIEEIPGSWKVTDLSSGFSEISSSMENIGIIADYILWGSIAATIVIIGLLILLFLRDRKHEIGIYLALGERKAVIVFQLIIEVMPLVIVGMTIALFIGNGLASSISQEMLRQDISENRNNAMEQEFNLLEELGYRFELTPEDMIENYQIGLDWQSVLLFYAIGLGAVLIVIIIPTVHVIRLNPKKVLM